MRTLLTPACTRYSWLNDFEYMSRTSGRHIPTSTPPSAEPAVRLVIFRPYHHSFSFSHITRRSQWGRQASAYPRPQSTKISGQHVPPFRDNAYPRWQPHEVSQPMVTSGWCIPVFVANGNFAPTLLVPRCGYT